MKGKNVFGFGLMRLPMKDGKVDYEETNKMVDAFIKEGFTYFDTAHGYLSEQSEIAFKECVAKRYDRSLYTIANKLSPNYFNSKEDIYKMFDLQLKACGVDYFDYYLMHAQGRNNYDQYKKYEAYEVAQELKKQGKIKYVGFSFHDSAEFLDLILTEHPEVDFVQIQLNYFDYNDENVQSRKCLEVCNKHNKPVVVMEPVKGGNLVNLPTEASEVFKSFGNNSNASYAIRFAASQPGVFMVLSGMSDLFQMEDNLSFMKDFTPLNEKEYEAIEKVCLILKSKATIQCTGCKYCVDGCPSKILIPNLFKDLNFKNMFNSPSINFFYQMHTKNNGKASDCIKCGKCERSCPQHLPIRDLLVQVSKEFEK